jgi:4-amino-4-deoxy-L-arabinose transferase-like glycosyltransferase
VVAGIGLLNKISVGFLGAAVAVALPFSSLRPHLRDWRLWLGGALAVLVFAPHLAWQVGHGWPTLEFIHNASTYKIVAMGPLEFISAQLLLIHPANLVVWLAGLI